jgi:hypothetical protein
MKCFSKQNFYLSKSRKMKNKISVDEKKAEKHSGPDDFIHGLLYLKGRIDWNFLLPGYPESSSKQKNLWSLSGSDKGA